MLTRREPQDGRLDVRGQLAPLEHAEPTAVLGRARVLGILAREIAEVLAREHAAVDLVGATPRRRPAVLARAGPGHEEDVAGLEGPARLEPFPVGDQAAVDLLLALGRARQLVLVEVVGLRLIELIQGDGIAVHHADDPVHDGLGVGRQGGAREERRADLAGGRGARRRPLGLADEGHPRGNGAACESGGDACDEDEPDRAPHARDSSSARSASRTASQGPVGIIASSVNSFRMVTPLPRRPTTTKMRSGVTGVDGAKVTSARPPPASRRSTPSRRLSTRSPTTSSSATTAGGGGPKRSASSARIWATSSSSPTSASRW